MCKWTITKMEILKDKYDITYRCGCTKEWVTLSREKKASSSKIVSSGGTLQINEQNVMCPYCGNIVTIQYDVE